MSSASSTTPSRILTAFHEAGHAVVSTTLEGPVAHATIVPSSTTRTAGHVLRHPHTAPLDLEGALKELVILDAGGQAVQIVSGGRVHPGLPLPGGGILRYTEGSRGDIKKTIGVWRYLEQHFEVERKMWYLPGVISLTSATSTSLLCRHWPGVVRVAELLLQKKTLTGEEILAELEVAKLGKISALLHRNMSRIGSPHTP